VRRGAATALWQAPPPRRHCSACAVGRFSAADVASACQPSRAGATRARPPQPPPPACTSLRRRHRTARGLANPCTACPGGRYGSAAAASTSVVCTELRGGQVQRARRQLACRLRRLRPGRLQQLGSREHRLRPALRAPRAPTARWPRALRVHPPDLATYNTAPGANCVLAGAASRRGALHGSVAAASTSAACTACAVGAYSALSTGTLGVRHRAGWARTARWPRAPRRLHRVRPQARTATRPRADHVLRVHRLPGGHVQRAGRRHVGVHDTCLPGSYAAGDRCGQPARCAAPAAYSTLAGNSAELHRVRRAGKYTALYGASGPSACAVSWRAAPRRRCWTPRARTCRPRSGVARHRGARGRRRRRRRAARRGGERRRLLSRFPQRRRYAVCGGRWAPAAGAAAAAAAAAPRACS
jgi:hypothetical protein